MIHGNTTGLKSSQVKALERIYRRRLAADEVISAELARYLTELSAELRRQIDESLTPEGSGEELTSVASHLLSELSQQIGIVVVPALGETVLRSISFVPLSGSRALCVLVSASGFVDSKVIETQRQVPREELTRISNYLTDNFGGKTLREIRDRLLRLMAEERAQMDQLLASAIQLARQALARTEDHGEHESNRQGPDWPGLCSSSSPGRRRSRSSWDVSADPRRGSSPLAADWRPEPHRR